jgi:hypothetical protein
MRCQWVLGLSGAFALLLLPLPLAARGPCTIIGTAGDDVFDQGPYGPGVVICGGRGNDVVWELRGAVFRGGRGHDRVELMTRGRFRGGDGADKVGRLEGGAFEGGS